MEYSFKKNKFSHVLHRHIKGGTNLQGLQALRESNHIYLYFIYSTIQVFGPF